MFWFKEKDSVDNTQMVWLLLSSAVQSQGRLSFSASTAAEGAGGHKELGGNRTRAFDPNGQRDISCYMISCKKNYFHSSNHKLCTHFTF